VRANPYVCVRNDGRSSFTGLASMDQTTPRRNAHRIIAFARAVFGPGVGSFRRRVWFVGVPHARGSVVPMGKRQIETGLASAQSSSKAGFIAGARRRGPGG